MTRHSTAITLLALFAAAAVGGCGGGGGANREAALPPPAGTTSTESTTNDTTTTTTEPTVDPEVRRWVRRWQRVFAKPMGRAGRILNRSTLPAVEGNSEANYALTGALNRIGRCQGDVFELEPVPPEMSRVHGLSDQVCRKLFVATDDVVDALNARDVAAGRQALDRIRKALVQLERAKQLAHAAVTP